MGKERFRVETYVSMFGQKSYIKRQVTLVGEVRLQIKTHVLMFPNKIVSIRRKFRKNTFFTDVEYRAYCLYLEHCFRQPVSLQG